MEEVPGRINAGHRLRLRKSLEGCPVDLTGAWVGSGDAATAKIWFELREELGSTEFMGYENEVASGNLLASVANGKKVESAKAGDEVQLILNQSPFYAESGGQVGDTGTMTTTDGTKVTITNTTKEAGSLWVHHARIEAGTLKVGAALDAVVDGKRRSAIRANHSATHLLHEALRRRLGDHVAQKAFAFRLRPAHWSDC